MTLTPVELHITSVYRELNGLCYVQLQNYLEQLNFCLVRRVL